METIAVADGRAAVGRLVRQTLEAEGMGVVRAATGEELHDALRDLPLRAIVVGQLPGMTAAELIKCIRERHDVALLALSEQGSARERTRLLDLGADDAIDLPFDPDELAARVRAVSRRGRETCRATRLRVGQVEVDLEGRSIKREGCEVAMTRREWTLFQSLAEHAGKVVTAEQLLTMAFGPAYRDDAQYLRVYISRLRSHLGSQAIRTYHGVGYMLVASPVS